MTVTMVQAYVISCTECPGASATRPIIVGAREDWAKADEIKTAHTHWHDDKERMTADALRKARVGRAALAKSMDPMKCQCFCPRVEDHLCDENGRDVIVHYPAFILGLTTKTGVMCTPCADAWMKRFKATMDDPDPHTAYEVRMYDKNGQKHVACFVLATGEEVEPAGTSGTDDSDGRGDDAQGVPSDAEGPEPSSGSGDDDGVLHVGTPPTASGSGE